MSQPNDDNDQNDNVISKDVKANIAMLIASYKLYKMMSSFVIDKNGYILSTPKALWAEPLLHMYKRANKSCIIATTEYSISQLQKELKKYKEVWSKIRSRGLKGDDEIIRQLTIIYYNIVFDDSFRNAIKNVFDTTQFMHGMMQSMSAAKHDRMFTDHIISYPGSSCIKCNGKLKYVYKAFREDLNGTIGISYHNKTGPALCVNYIKKCGKCKINYQLNRIDCENGETIFLDPEAFKTFTMDNKPRATYDQSIYQSIKRHQYCHKPTSIKAFRHHYNEEWKDEYVELSKHAKTSLSVELGYNNILRNFYFYSLLCRIRDTDSIEDFGSIKIGDRSIKIALKVSKEDKEAARKYYHCINEAIITRKAKKNGKKKESKTSDNYRDSHHYLEHFVNKYYKELINAEISELKEVPVKLNDSGIIEIYVGWFIVYGDGGEKISRIRCAYPSFLAKYDIYIHKNTNTSTEEAKHQSEDDADIDNIDNDGDIDLNLNNNSRLYSIRRYFACDHTPARMTTSSNDAGLKSSFKCCRHHTASFINYHNFKPADIPLFIHWHQMHSAIAGLKNINVKEALLQQYTVDDEVLDAITTRRKKKITEFEQKIAKFIQEHPDEHERFEQFFNKINDQLISYKQGMSEANKIGVSLHHRNCKAKGQAKAKADIEKDMNVEYEQNIIDILGDEDVNLEEGYMDISQRQREQLHLEIQNNKKLADYKGCRKSKNFTKATTARTKGLNVLMSCANMIINLREEIVRETPISVVLDVVDTFTKNPAAIEYANRIEAIGYDFMCKMYYCLKSNDKHKTLSDLQMSFWFDIIWRAFIDIWHVAKHTDPLCCKDGTFHPMLPKFNKVLYNITSMMKRCNDLIAEQFWSTMNATGQLKAMNQETMLIFLLEKRSYYNKIRKQAIKDEGYTFIPIEWCTKLRDIEAGANVQLPTTEELFKANKDHLKKVEIKPDKIEAVKRLINANKAKVNGNKRVRSQLESQASGGPQAKRMRTN